MSNDPCITFHTKKRHGFVFTDGYNSVSDAELISLLRQSRAMTKSLEDELARRQTNTHPVEESAEVRDLGAAVDVNEKTQSTQDAAGHMERIDQGRPNVMEPYARRLRIMEQELVSLHAGFAL